MKLTTYEGMFLFDPSTATRWEAVEGEVGRIIDRAEAELIGIERWDERRLAYEVKHRKRGCYVLTYFRAPGSKVAGIERDARLSEMILRLLVVRCGLTEEQARNENIKIDVQRFPWKFSGRATMMGAPEGLTKIIIDPDTQRILGVGITGRNTEGLISEGVLAIEMGALAEDMALSIHPHPTLSETEGEAAEIFLGSATHILAKKKKP